MCIYMSRGIKRYTCLCVSLNVNYTLEKTGRERGDSKQELAWQVGRGRGLEALPLLSGLAACGLAPCNATTSCPFSSTLPLTSGGDSPGEQMPASVGAGGLRKWLFLLGSQPVRLMGEGPAASIMGPDS